ncbi:hypothetical protein SAMN05518849_11013 [Sphingobium sp. AP50]|uniref:polyketide cyclase n=1 Tax=Sphingobium sp. AP50 TaxID=1884369 RepID=UPI0008BB9271|nr:polyketide cyclase [Sphingobium sp. AP50]SEJ63268.1 hypothetical protein SAMN05518849_11013 [Sphingobium sp. AP50]
MLAARSIDIAIRVPLAQAYGFASQPENFPRWAAGLSASLHREGDDWIADTPEGRAIVTFSPPNDFGILDHHVRLPGKPDIHIPLRMIANGDGTQVVFTLFRQPDMDDAAFDRDADLVTKDLQRLKALLESLYPA